ncbi:MAG: carbamoyl-phosphate synthase large subunit [Phycisphaeraceae bacterium]
MPKRTDLKTILIIGSGPIVIGQGCEFDYSGTQACKALREEGYKVVLVNSNPATIMTDPEMADRTYIEPITPEAVTKIIEKEKDGPYHIDALLPTLGGQTALNCACKLFDDGVLTKFGIEMIGANREVIYRAEDRKIFKEIVEGIGLKMPKAATANTMDEAFTVLEMTGLPAIIRPAFTLGGTGGGIAYNREEFEDIVKRGLDASMTHQVLIDQSVLGWKEYELEVMRDHDDNAVIICAIENFDPMGIHTGDSITVAPAQTLTDREYQRMRDASLAIIRAIGVETGGCNIQFAINPKPDTDEGEMVVVEMNPRVSRSSALASKATGFPIAKIAAKLAVGYSMWELPNDITKKTVACFEPTIDYVVTKIPRWTFEKFPEADETLTTQMKSVGEAMSIGRTFKESLQKGLRSMEIKRFGLGLDTQDDWLNSMRMTLAWLKEKHPNALPALQKVAANAAGTTKATELQAVSILYHDPVLYPKLSASAKQQLDVLLESLGAGHGSVFREAANHTSGAEQLVESSWPIEAEKIQRKLNVPSQGRLFFIRYAFKMGWSIEQVYDATMIDPWFLDQIKQLVDFEQVLIGYSKLEEMPRDVLFQAKQMGYSDAQLAGLYLGKISPENILTVRRHRQQQRIATVYKLVDTCAAEFEAATPYYYSTYESPVWQVGREGESGGTPAIFDDEVRVTDKKKIVILGGGPNRIGQGIEFDYCCVQAAFAARELGYEAVMINSNPETVSTDYDTSDLLFFEPLTFEDALNICEKLNGQPFAPRSDEVTKRRSNEVSDSVTSSLRHSVTSSGLLAGVIVQFGGQTPLNLAHALEMAGVPIIGTSVDSIDRAGDRERFRELVKSLGIRQPVNGIAHNVEEAVQIANQIGYPVLVRPSFVLGGRAMETVFDDKQLREYFHIALGASDLADQPILIDKFLSEAIECDVDVIADYGVEGGGKALVCGVMEHIEEAGIHSGDSACAIPPYSLPPRVVEELKRQSRQLAEALQVRGLMNVQWAIKRAQDGGHEIYVIEVNPRASRTVPFVSKATGLSWARIAAKVMIQESLASLGVENEITPAHTSVKESVFPFSKFPGVDVILGPEMRSTGEVMGIDADFPIAFAKSQMAAGTILPTRGKVFISVRDADKKSIVPVAKKLLEMGFTVVTTGGTRTILEQNGVATERLKKISEGRPNCIDLIKNKELALIINTPTRKGINTDEGRLRSTAVRFNVPMVTTTTGAAAAVLAIEALKAGTWGVRAIQDYFAVEQEPAAAASGEALR